MKVLMVHSVPLNGGDEALLRATVEFLRVRWTGMEIAVSCREVEKCRKRLPDLDLFPDLECASGTEEGVFRGAVEGTRRVLRALGVRETMFRWLDWMTATEEQKRILRLYGESDLILSSPGGFFHDHYPVEGRLRGLEAALDMGKPVILFAQSIGPFWKKRSRKRVTEVFNRVSRICVRDSLSREHLLDLGVDDSRIRTTADAAFLWRQIAPEMFRARSGPVDRIAMSFRIWPHGDATVVVETVKKAVLLCRHLLSDAERSLLFLSTCQGIPGYVDDSEVALRIVEKLPEGLQTRCRVDRERYSPRDLIRLLGSCDAFIGMRLHGCLLAMLGGTPAMGIGYESKTSEIFRQLGFESFQVGFEKGEEEWLQCAGNFLEQTGEIHNVLAERLDRLCAAADRNLDAVSECLPGKG